MNKIEFQVIRRPRRRTASISVKPDGTVRVLVPASLSDDQVTELVERKSTWIQNKIAHFEAICNNEKDKEYVSGERVFYLGRSYRMEVVDEDDSSDAVKLMNGRFIVQVHPGLDEGNRKFLIRERFSGWYQQKAEVRLREKVVRFAKQMNVAPRSVGVKGYTSRWGSCHSDGRLYFNWRIIMAPHSVIDYVVVHELAHLVHGNHSKKFWKLVESILPDYTERKAWLNLKGRGLRV
jgi:predicted metal-dependent hydrolase